MVTIDKCKTCGGPINRVGNSYVCEYCGNKWQIDSSDDIHAVDRANAWSALRDGDFEKAAELFENIIVKEAKNHEAYWGRALALAGIVYVTDMNENKKVPTCNNITENSFIKDKDVQKAISLAPADIADGYKQQAEYIEKVRVEWLEKASKEPAYDVFISFKDSDRENGIERTQDSIDAQDLYNALIAEGYKVFFSRISLRDKIAEQYEPYIYNAIKTAKVMIVFGEKAEYFSSVWIKNEWSRFKTRIEKGEKHKNSLVVVYKNMNPGDLPVILKSRQCLNASDMTFLFDLTRHIKRVVSESPQDVRVEKISIQGGQVAKKATTLVTNSVQVREVGRGAIAETDITERQSIDLLWTYLEAEQWNESLKMAEDLLFDNPASAEVIWCKLLAEHKVSNVKDLLVRLPANQSVIFTQIEKVLDCACKDLARKILNDLYTNATTIPDSSCAKLLQTILPYAFSDRQKQIQKSFESTINKAMYQSFCVLLTTLEESQVDTYIDYHLRFEEVTKDEKTRELCLKKILEVDEGNLVVLTKFFEKALHSGLSVEQMKYALENLLKFSYDTDTVVGNYLIWLSLNAKTQAHAEFAKELLRYYSKDIDDILQLLSDLAKKMIDLQAFDVAQYFLQLILSKDQNRSDVLWDICLIKTKAKNEREAKYSDILLNDIPEFKKLLTKVDKQRQLALIKLTKFQEGYHRVRPYMERAEKLRNSVNSAGWKSIYFIKPDGRVYLSTEDSARPTNLYDITGIYHDTGTLTVLFLNKRNRLIEQLMVGYSKSDQICIPGQKEYPENIWAPLRYLPGELTISGKIIGSGGNIAVKESTGVIKVLHSQDAKSRDNMLNPRWTEEFKGIKGIVAYRDWHGITEDGHVFSEDGKEIAGWTDIVDVCYTTDVLFGLRADGTVVARDKKHDLSNWNDIVAISRYRGLYGIKSDGTVLTTNVNNRPYVSSIKNAVAFSNGYIIKADGTVTGIDSNRAPAISNVRLFNNIETLEEERKEASEATSSQRSTGGGCYVATAVYGSYDCPQVWTLRRYRDNTLAKTWYGRLFVRTYYAVSPTLVKWFGNTGWFKKLWKGKLDRMVSVLNATGVEDTPYKDTLW